MESLTNDKIKMNNKLLDNRASKRLGFRTPAEVFNLSLLRVAVRP